MASESKPLFLLADSQLLFWKNEDNPILNCLTELTTDKAPKAAYIGASNGDDPEFYSIFGAAMESVGITDHKMILSSFKEEDQSFVKQADVILLAGGEVERGWNMFTETGLNELLPRRCSEGAVLIGVSAGAVQLGMFGLIEAKDAPNKLLGMLKIVPFIIGAHEEKEEWISLKTTIELLNMSYRGIGLPMGSGAIYHPDHSLEAIRYSLHEFVKQEEGVRHSLILPKSSIPAEAAEDQ